MEELYLLISFGDLAECCGIESTQLCSAIKSLMQSGYADQLEFDIATLDFKVKLKPDYSDIPKYHYLATRQGMLAHHS